MKSTRLFVLSFALTMATVITGYYALFRYQFGAPIPASYDLSYWISWKEHLAQQPGNSRLLIVGDSSSLFGFDSEVMEREMGRKVVNLSLHGGLPLDWLTRFAIEVSRPGDTVIMPLSWPYYWRDYRVPEKWMVEQIVAWDHRYFDDSSFVHKARYVTSLSPADLWSNVKTVERRDEILAKNPARELMDYSEVIKRINGATIDKSNPYSYLNLGPRGDMRGACGNAGGQLQASAVYGNGKINKHEIELLRKTSAELASRGVSLVVMPAPTVSDAGSNANGYLDRLDSTFRALKWAGVKTAGAPADFYFEPAAFFDTSFHINCEHAGERTMRMVKALRGTGLTADLRDEG